VYIDTVQLNNTVYCRSAATKLGSQTGLRPAKWLYCGYRREKSRAKHWKATSTLTRSAEVRRFIWIVSLFVSRECRNWLYECRLYFFFLKCRAPLVKSLDLFEKSIFLDVGSWCGLWNALYRDHYYYSTDKELARLSSCSGPTWMVAVQALFFGSFFSSCVPDS
jgi:hypothetical protein